MPQGAHSQHGKRTSIARAPIQPHSGSRMTAQATAKRPSAALSSRFTVLLTSSAPAKTPPDELIASGGVYCVCQA